MGGFDILIESMEKHKKLLKHAYVRELLRSACDALVSLSLLSLCELQMSGVWQFLFQFPDLCSNLMIVSAECADGTLQTKATRITEEVGNVEAKRKAIREAIQEGYSEKMIAIQAMLIDIQEFPKRFKDWQTEGYRKHYGSSEDRTDYDFHVLATFLEKNNQCKNDVSGMYVACQLEDRSFAAKETSLSNSWDLFIQKCRQPISKGGY